MIFRSSVYLGSGLFYEGSLFAIWMVYAEPNPGPRSCRPVHLFFRVSLPQPSAQVGPGDHDSDRLPLDGVRWLGVVYVQCVSAKKWPYPRGFVADCPHSVDGYLASALRCVSLSKQATSPMSLLD